VINSAQLLVDLKREVRRLEADLRARAEDGTTEWGARLRQEYQRAQDRERTGLSWIDWRDGEIAQAAVAWIIATVFVRFAEDNRLLRGAELDGRPVALPWIAAPGHGLERAVENESAFYAASPTSTSRDWLQQAFRTLAALPAGRPLVDPDHSPVWHAPISAGATDRLLVFFRQTTPEGSLVHDFRDPELGTRFLGDLYQDLSEHAKKTYALLQTPVFVEEFILDLTLTPAIAEFGLTGLKLIDPTCGSGHFLLGAFDRLTVAWKAAAPGLDAGERVQRALNSIHGVDLNPFATAIARFRLTVAAIRAAGISTLVAAPAFRYHLAIGDSLLGGAAHQATLDLGGGEVFQYAVEDLQAHTDILRPGQYHVVVGNPPYIQVKDRVLNQAYRDRYSTCSGKYALSVPFMELFFRLARRSESGVGPGYVGQITSNAFMKREFGKKLIEQFLSGKFTGPGHPEYVDLSHIIDTSGAFIPGHGIPTVILVGRPRRPQMDTIRAVLGVRGEPGQPEEPADGLAWRDIVDHLAQPGYNGTYVSVANMPRGTYESFPWSLSGGGAGELRERIESASPTVLRDAVSEAGIMAVLGEEEAYETPSWVREPTIELVIGGDIRDFSLRSTPRWWPYDSNLGVASNAGNSHWMWPFRRVVSGYLMFGKTREQRGLNWFEYGMLARAKMHTPLSITFAFVATHNHFVLDRGMKVFNRSAPVIKLPDGATEDDHYNLLGILNSSTALFWLKQVSQPKGGSGIGRGIQDEEWEARYEFTSTKLEDFPLPRERAREIARAIDGVARLRAEASPAAALESGAVAGLTSTSAEWTRLGREMIALQEELDWRTYVAYGLADPDLAPELPELLPIDANERAFEIRLARAVADGDIETAWFERHGREPLTALPTLWPVWYRDLVERRLEAMDSNSALHLLERPEYKRRWAGASWNELLSSAVRDEILGRIEAPDLWCDSAGRPQIRSVAQLADDLRHDERLRELLVIHTGSLDYDLPVLLGQILDSRAVPGLAALRYKPSGLEKFRAWERTWELQRAEDRGERVTVSVPPRYAPADFLKQGYWSARGKLDVPTERFISFPGSNLPDNPTELYGWAGWDHAERGQAVAALANTLVRASAPGEQVIPLIGVLLELEPWLKQWHDVIDPRAGVSPDAAISAVTTSLLGRLGIGRDTVVAWRPPTVTPRRGRRSAS
jgi:hypothetical protein